MRVLVVEDDESVRLLFRLMLREGGHAAVFAESLAAAGKAIAEGGPFDLLITDHTLPDGSGLDAARLFRERFPQGKIMLSTGSVKVGELLGDRRAEGVAGVLEKPFDPDEALARIQEVLGQGS